MLDAAAGGALAARTSAGCADVTDENATTAPSNARRTSRVWERRMSRFWECPDVLQLARRLPKPWAQHCECNEQRGAPDLCGEDIPKTSDAPLRCALGFKGVVTRPDSDTIRTNAGGNQMSIWVRTLLVAILSLSLSPVLALSLIHI